MFLIIPLKKIHEKSFLPFPRFSLATEFSKLVKKITTNENISNRRGGGTANLEMICNTFCRLWLGPRWARCWSTQTMAYRGGGHSFHTVESIRKPTAPTNPPTNTSSFEMTLFWDFWAVSVVFECPVNEELGERAVGPESETTFRDK